MCFSIDKICGFSCSQHVHNMFTAVHKIIICRDYEQKSGGYEHVMNNISTARMCCFIRWFMSDIDMSDMPMCHMYLYIHVYMRSSCVVLSVYTYGNFPHPHTKIFFNWPFGICNVHVTLCKFFYVKSYSADMQIHIYRFMQHSNYVV